MEIYCSKKHFQDNLKIIMAAIDMNGRQFGELIGVTRQAVGVWARREHEMPEYVFLAYKYVFMKMEITAEKRALLRTIYNQEFINKRNEA